MRDEDDTLLAARQRPLSLGAEELAGVLAAAARLHHAREEGGPAAAVAAEIAQATGIDEATLARAQADRRLHGALAGLTAGDRRWFSLKRLVAGLPGSLLPSPSAASGRVRAHVLATRAGLERQAGANRLAVWLAHRSLAHDPSCYKAWYELGRALERLSRLEEACDAYRLAIAHGVAEGPAVRDPAPLSSALNNLAVLIEGAVGDEAAEALYLEACAVRPSNGIAAYNLALLYKARGRLADALTWLARAEALRPDDADVTRELGIVKALQAQP